MFYSVAVAARNGWKVILNDRPKRLPDRVMQRLFVRLVLGKKPLVLELAPQNLRDVQMRAVRRQEEHEHASDKDRASSGPAIRTRHRAVH